MARTTSSPKPSPNVEKSFNHLALSGFPIDDDMFVSDYNENKLTPGELSSDLAYTPNLMPRVIELNIQDDLDNGLIDLEQAKKRKMEHLQNYRGLLAEAGKFKK